MIAVPLNYEGPNYPAAVLKHDLGEFFEQHPDEQYRAYHDYQSGYFICEMPQAAELVFILKYPRYQRYQHG